MSSMVRIDRDRAMHDLVSAAAEAYGVVFSRKTPDGKRRGLAKAIQRARRSEPPVTSEEIDAIVDDAKRGGMDVHGVADEFISKWLAPKDSR